MQTFLGCLLLLCVSAMQLEKFEGSQCKDKNGAARYDKAACEACTTYQRVFTCAYNPTTGNCRRATKEATWIKKGGCTPAALYAREERPVVTGNCARSPCLQEFRDQNPVQWDADDLTIHPNLRWTDPTVFATNMYKDKPDNYLCRSASASPVGTVASLQSQNWPNMVAAVGTAQAATQMRAGGFFLQGAIAMRHDDRGPEIIFKEGFEAANISPSHPNHEDCKENNFPKLKQEYFATHQQNTDMGHTYCTLISTTTCLGVGFSARGWTFAIVIPESYDFLHAYANVNGHEDLNSEVMGILKVPHTHIYAAREFAPIEERDINTGKIDSLWDRGGKPGLMVPKPKIIFNPLFNVVLTKQEEDALLRMLHVSCSGGNAAGDCV